MGNYLLNNVLMIEKKKITEKTFILFIIICFISLFLRLYQINFEDYWFDEQASFWVSDPFLSYNQTLERSYDLDRGTHIIFNIILKKFFHLFGYEPQYGRFLPLFFGFISIPVISYLAFQLQKNRSYLLVAFLCSINFYLISYSQELRSYSLTFLLSLLSIIFFYKIIENEIPLNKKIFYYFLYILFSLLGACIHIYFFIIIFSQASYLLLNYYFKKKEITLAFLSIFCVIVLYFILMFDSLLMQLSIDNFWIKQVNADFFLNFYFSRYFGSRIMGTIYLLVLIYLLFYNRKKIFCFDDKNFLLLLIIFYSYFLPIFYSFLKHPILTDRYIIFVLVPIFILISNLTLSLKNKKIKFFILFLICTSSLANNYIEIFKRKISKPQFNESFKYIINSNVKNVLIKSPDSIEKIIINYAKNTKTAKEGTLTFYTSDDKIEGLNKIWLTCYEPINDFDCSYDFNSNLNFKKVDNLKYYLIRSTLYTK